MDLQKQIEKLLTEYHYEPFEKHQYLRSYPVVKMDSFIAKDYENVEHTFKIIHKTVDDNYTQSLCVSFDDGEYYCRTEGRITNEKGEQNFAGLEGVLKYLFKESQNSYFYPIERTVNNVKFQGIERLKPMFTSDIEGKELESFLQEISSQSRNGRIRFHSLNNFEKDKPYQNFTMLLNDEINAFRAEKSETGRWLIKAITFQPATC